MSVAAAAPEDIHSKNDNLDEDHLRAHNLDLCAIFSDQNLTVSSFFNQLLARAAPVARLISFAVDRAVRAARTH